MPRTLSAALNSAWRVPTPSQCVSACVACEARAGPDALPGRGEAAMRYRPARAGPYRISPGRAGGKNSERCKARAAW